VDQEKVGMITEEEIQNNSKIKIRFN
jgi:hypothetical protein